MLENCMNTNHFTHPFFMQVKILFLTEDFSFNEVLIKTVRSVGCEVPQHLPQADIISKSTEWMHIFLKFYVLELALKN